MKKFTFLLSLLLAFVGVTASAQGLKISDAPEGENWAADTQWYLIRVAAIDYWHPNAGYLGTEEANLSDTDLRTDITTVSATDKVLWCIVGSEAEGYKFYNKGEGSSKVLGVATNGKPKLYEATATDAKALTFDIASSTYDSFAKCVKCHAQNDGGYWWNNANKSGKELCVLGTWNNNASNAGTRGNAFYFIPVSNVEEAPTVAKKVNLIDRFQFIPGVKANCAEQKTAWEANIDESSYNAYYASAKNYLDKTYYRITNLKTGKNVLTADKTQAVCVDNAQKKNNASAIWKFILSNDGVKLYNVNTESYLGELSGTNSPLTPMKADEAQGSFYKVNEYDTQGTYGFVLRDGNNGRMNVETTGAIDKWEGEPGAFNQVTWTIEVANELEVALHAVNGKSYATTYLPVGVSAVTDAKAYVAATPVNNETVMTEAASFGAKTGVLLVSDNAADKAVLTIGDVTSEVTSALSGTLLAKDITDQTNYLVFGKNKAAETEVGFFEPLTSVTSIPANRAFFEGVASAAIALNFGGNVTAIDQVVNNANVNAPIFDLAGRRVVKAAKGGVYIQNGKKYIVK